MVNDDPFAVRVGDVVGVQVPGAQTAPGVDSTDLDVNLTVRHTALVGDLINSRTAQGNMRVTVEGASMKGRISTAIQSATSGREPSHDTYKLIGDVTNSFTSTKDANGMEVSLDSGSSWTVTGTSYLTSLKVVDGAAITGAAERKLNMTVNGVSLQIEPGSYRGNIVLKLEPIDR